MRKLALLLLVLLTLGMLSANVVAQDTSELGQQVLDAHTDCEVDLTGETITLYHIGDLSGAFAFITQPIVAAIADGLAFYNANGGLCGATMATFNEDTGGSQEATQAAYDRFTADFADMKFLLLYASADAELLRDQLAEDEIVSAISAGSVVGLYGEDAQTPGWLYATNPLYADQLGSFCDYIGGNEMYPDPKIGYISWPGPFGEAAFTPETIAYCAEQGVEILPEKQIFLPTDTDITNQVLNLVDAGANILYTNTLASGPVLVSETVRALGLEGEVQLAGVNWVMDTSVGLLSSQRAPEDGLPAVNGMLGSMPFYWWTERAQAGVAFVNEQATLNERSLSTQNIAYILTWGSVNLFVEAYIQTVNRVGSLDAVTGAELKATMDALDYDVLLGVINANWPEGIRATSANRIAQMAFLNVTGDGPATSRDDVMVVETPNGNIMVPIVIPLTDFAPAPDLRPKAE